MNSLVIPSGYQNDANQVAGYKQNNAQVINHGVAYV